MTARDALSCREATELVTDALEAALPETTRLRFEDHMISCAACQTFARQMRQTIAVLRTLPREPVRPPNDRVLEAIRRRRRSDRE
jgi:hypothetical protein